MIKILSILLLAGITACNSKTDQQAKEKQHYEKAVETLAEKEKKNPLLFLTVSNSDKHNLLGQTVIKGAVTNKAKVCAYKDVLLEVSFFSKTGTLLEKGNETVYEKIEPGKSSQFKIKNFAPKGADSIAIKVLGAKTD